MKRGEKFFLGCVTAAALVFCFVTLRNAKVDGENGAVGGTPRASAEEHGGKPKDVNLEEIKKYIKQGFLSGHEARFYRNIEGAEPVTPGGEKSGKGEDAEKNTGVGGAMP